MKKVLAYTCLLLIFWVHANAQYKAGMRFFERYDYYKAIKKFKNVTSSDAHRADALVRLGDCYRLLRDFKNSARYYKQAVEAGSKDPQLHYYYGLALKSINDYNEALKEFSLYLQENPTDAKAKNALKSCTEMKAMLSMPVEYKTKNLDLNTEGSEFSPVIFENGLVFVSSQKSDLVNINKFDTDGTPYYTLYFSEKKNDSTFSSAKNFSKKINSPFHDGPVCFSEDKYTAFFTHVEYIERKKKKDFVNQAKLYYAQRKNGSWKKPLAFAYNSDDCSVAHPTLSKDGNRLFFASNMPGTYGGMDIWYCTREGENWSKPVNLGADINTPGNEEFPYLRKDGVLFFSSDALPGLGGLDIFSAREIAGKWVLNKNEGVGLNSFADDFGVVFEDNNRGYVSSNRDGGKGMDDIYSFTYAPAGITVEGSVLLSKNVNDPAKNVQVFLQDDQSNPVSASITNEVGYFKFDHLKPGTYQVRLDQDDAKLQKKRRYYYSNSSGNVVRVTVINEKGEKYVFTNLPAETSNINELTENDIALAGVLVYGQNPSKPIPDATVLLKDANDKVIDEAKTNFFGSFAFNKVAPDDDYTMEIIAPPGLNIPANTRIVLTNKNGKEIRVLRADKRSRYKFSKLGSEGGGLSDLKVDESDLVMDFCGKILDAQKKKLPGAQVVITNEKGDTVYSKITDVNGVFKFTSLQALNNYNLSVADDEKTKKFDSLFVSDNDGNIVKKLIRDFRNGFQYKILGAERTALKQLYVEDPWLNVLSLKEKETTIQENVYYASGEYKLSPDGMNILDKVILVLKSNPAIKVEIGSHTDSKGNDEFNLNLSKKRAGAAAAYVIAHGIKADRVKGIGYGESKLINNCGNESACADAEHAKNRRTEFRIINAR